MKNLNELFRFKIAFAVLISAVCTMRSHAQSNGVPAPVHVVIDNYFGQEIRDPYRYMEENTPEAAEWIREQGRYTESVLGALPERNRLRDRLRVLDEQMGARYLWVSRLPGNRYLYAKSSPKDDTYKLYVRNGLKGPERLVVDPEKFKKGAEPASLEAVYQCPYNNLVAYAISIGNSERATLHVMDMSTGKDIETPIESVLRFASIDWSEDGRSFFYFKLPKLGAGASASERYLNGEVRRHIVGQESSGDRLMIGPSDDAPLRSEPTQWPSINMPIGSRWALGVITDGVRAERVVYSALKKEVEQGTAKWRKIIDFRDEVTELSVHGEELYGISHKDAPRGKVIRISLSEQGEVLSRDVLNERDSTPVSLGTTRDALYVTARNGVTARLLRIPYESLKAEEVSLPVDGVPELYSIDQRMEGPVFTVRSWTSAEEVFSYSEGKVWNTQLRPKSSTEKRVRLQITHAEVASHDGVKVPLTIIHRDKLSQNSDNMVYLLGYGSYGTSMEPTFNAFVLAWYEMGGTIAVAHVRGGGEFGEEWHEAGSKAKKPNTWLDFIACAEYLVRERYTRPGRLVAGGASAGGILVGRAITERPDLFAAAWIGAGVTDTVREEFQKNGPVNIPEFGTVKKAEDFPSLLEMSAFHHVKDGTKYPAVLLTTGLNDPVVDPWQPAKMAARLRAASASGKPVLLRVDNAGHDQWGSTRSELYALRADQLAFMLWQLGITKDKAPPKTTPGLNRAQ